MDFVKHPFSEILPDGYRLATVEEVLKFREVIQAQSLLNEGDTVRLKNGFLRSQNFEVGNKFLSDKASHKLGVACTFQEIQLESQDDKLIALLYASEADDIEEIKALIKEAGPQILRAESEDISGGNVLHHSARHGRCNALKLLLTTEGVAVDLKDQAGNTVVHCSAIGGQAQALKVLLDDDRVKKLINDRNKYGETPLMRAAQSGSCEACAVLLGAESVAVDLTKGENGFNLLHFAAYYGKAEALKVLLDDARVKKLINHPTKIGSTPLMVTTEKGYCEACAVLLGEESVAVDVKDNDGDNVLHSAVYYGNAETLKVLLDDERVRNLINDPNKNGETPVMVAARRGHSEACAVLLGVESVALDLTKVDNAAFNVLHNAAYYGKAETLKVLLDDERVNKLINHPSKIGSTPLMVAAEKGYAEACAVLLGVESVAVDWKDNDGRTVLGVAASFGRAEALKVLLDDDRVRKLINNRNNNSSTPLMVAAAKGHSEACALLLGAESVAVDWKDKDGDNVLGIAAYFGKAEALKVLLDDERVKKLITDRNKAGSTPLMVAVRKGYAEACAVLLGAESVALEWMKGDNGFNILHIAAYYGSGEALKVFLDDERFKKLINDRNKYGETPLMVAAERESSEALAVLLGVESLAMDLKDNNGDTVLHRAAYGGKVEALKVLLDDERAKGLMNKQNGDGKTALWIASGRRTGDDSRKAYEIVKMLIEHPGLSIIQMRDRKGETALHVACRQGDVEVVELLLEKDESLATKRDFAGETPLHEAARASRPDVVEKLLGLKQFPPDLLEADQRDEDGRTALHWAAAATTESDQEAPALRVVKLLLEHANSGGYKPLLLWASAGPILGTADRCARFQSVKTHLEKEMAHVNATNLLKMAVDLSKFGMARELINRGADTSAIKDTDLNALMQSICPRASDQPALEDTLGRIHLARGIAALLLNPFTGTPITVGILGPWGTGKSSIMQQVEISLLMTAIQRNLREPHLSEQFPGVRKSTFTQEGKKLRQLVSKSIEDIMNSGADDDIQRFNWSWLHSLQRNLVFWQCRKERSQEEDQEKTIGNFLLEYRQEHHKLLKGLAIADRNKLVHVPSLANKSGQVIGEIPAVLTVRYNAWLYQGKVEALAGLAVQITREMEACLTKAQWLRMCCINAWKRHQDVILVQLLLPLIVCMILGGWIAWLVWKLISLHGDNSALSQFKYASVPVSVLVISWIVISKIINFIQPVSQQLLDVTHVQGHDAKLGYQQQVIEDIEFLKEEMCKTSTFFWNVLGRCWPTGFFRHRDYIPGTGIPKLIPSSDKLHIFVFIDDLDRCNEESYVLQMVSAINLVLAVCEINVVLGVDTEMIEQAIRNQFPQDGKSELATKFLQKIIQVPVHLPEPSEKELQRFLGKQLGKRLDNKTNGIVAALEDSQQILEATPHDRYGSFVASEDSQQILAKTSHGQSGDSTQQTDVHATSKRGEEIGAATNEEMRSDLAIDLEHADNQVNKADVGADDGTESATTKNKNIGMRS